MVNMQIVIRVEANIFMTVATIRIHRHVVLSTKLTLVITIMNFMITAVMYVAIAMETRLSNTLLVTIDIILKMSAAKTRILETWKIVIANKMSTMMQSP